ncbi:MAG: RnfABCDGE type electron transport complex subunit D [Gammaproteobacteria bacterium]|jgi:Na+-translocating ferredoxin:NAD+ oxidoreductase subunit D|nr:RnfABCDGE type electron transport complex subunit D [Gammaproteobacteria bacterium]MBT5204563.1 RnfABCDGE type electron transport complex subunit D [Gammaproteobacteria bacterium]MBT5604059.1 RnfABCDGE type electron transport complex subunit D [Gammaproteobacteria bacterium]MBT6244827.1 RnfABCDGE type electron transport complex subunit D [Gammaproteobacteria bacterium]
MNTRQFMYHTMLALAPGAMVMIYFYGLGILFNLVICIASGWICETLIYKLNPSAAGYPTDGSGLLSCALLGLALPPFLPIHIAIAGVIFALVFGKHVYGGLGQNIFNPAMVGYAGLIIAFPLAMTQWHYNGPVTYDLQTLAAMKTGLIEIQGFSGATPLDLFRHRQGQTVMEFLADQANVLHAFTWINLAFLLGGLYLLRVKVISWHMPAAMLAGLLIPSLAFYDSGSSASLGSPLFHLFSGATMLGAFFIVTDPVSSPDSRTGQLIFAACVGLLIFLIRSIGAYPDGLAFAILLMNASTPLLDLWLGREHQLINSDHE